MEYRISAEAKNFTAVHTLVEDAMLGDEHVVRIVKKDKIDLPDENTYALVNGVPFHNGTIEARLRSRLLPDAPAHARGFLGIVYRANEQNSEFESFYVRPTNGRGCSDPVRKAHGCQYFSYPGFTFAYFREFGISGYEAPTETALDEWFTLKAVIRDETASFYVDGKPVLTVPQMKHGADAQGSLGIYVDIGTEGFVSDLKITCEE